MFSLGHAVASFARTKWVSRAGLDRKAFERWQSRALDRWLSQALPMASFYRGMPPRLDALPVTDKSLLMSCFGDFNRHNLSADQAWQALQGDCRIGDLIVGASTGTSGNRGLFVISEHERFAWLGTIMAKAIPDILWRRHRVAIVLPQSTALYDSARTTRRIDLRFYSLTRDLAQWRNDIEDFRPTVIVAPPKVLRHFAEAGYALAQARAFSAAETLDPVDRALIEPFFTGGFGQIYMATEGLFAVTCAHGRLHLAEDSVFFEFEPVGDGLVTPLVTAFQRRTQIMARYRMNDLLRLSASPCPCGSPLRVVDEVAGRMDDVFRFQRDGDMTLVTPDILRNAILDAGRQITDFRLVQTSPDQIDLILLPDLVEEQAKAAEASLCSLLRERHLFPEIRLVRQNLELDRSRKLRRVESRLEPAASHAGESNA